jgi:hypothetical protein
MDLDWCSEEDLKNRIIFNDNSIISNNKKNCNVEEIKKVQEIIVNKSEIKIEDCFNLNLDVKNSKELLNVLLFLSNVSNYLRTFIKNKSIKSFDSNTNSKLYDEYISILEDTDFNQIIDYLKWIKDASINIKKYFLVSNRKDNSSDPFNIKPFKTSSYKFCNFKESCSIHKNKNKFCEKNHFVFDMIINDISKLIESVLLVEKDNFNWLLNNKNILILYDDHKKYIVKKIKNDMLNNEITENEFMIDKSLIFKSFDVISYVLNKMYDEASSFINYNLVSTQIII